MTFPLTRSADSSGAERERTPRGGGLHALFRKELADQLNSNRFLLLFALLAIAGVTGFYGALSTIRDSTEELDFLYLTLFTTRWLWRWSVSMWVATSTSKSGNSRWTSSSAMAWASWGVRSSVSAKDWTKW